MPKLTLSTISSRYASVAALNANFQAIVTALENTLSLDGTTPNAMSANLDMNSNRILNLPDATTAGEPVSYDQWAAGATSTPTSATAVTYTPDGTGAVARSVAGKLQEWTSVTDFGAVGDGTTDDSAALSLAATAAANRTLFWPAGTYKCSNNVTFASTVTHFFEKAATLSVDVTKTVTFSGPVVALYGNVTGGAGTTTFGADGNVFFNSSGGSGGFGFGTNVPSGTDDFMHLQRNVNTSVGMLIKNQNAGALAETFIHLFSDVGDAGGDLRMSANSVAGGSLVDIVAGGNLAFSIIQASNANMDFYTNNLKSFSIRPSGGTTVNYATVKGGAAGSSVQFDVDGTDSNISVIHNLKGTGSFFFRTGTATVYQFEIMHTASAANRVVVTGAAAGANPRIGASGENLILGTGSAISTGATAGYVMVPSCAGTPTGVPTGNAGGRIGMVYDTTAQKLWFYNGSWRGVLVA